MDARRLPLENCWCCLRQNVLYVLHEVATLQPGGFTIEARPEVAVVAGNGRDRARFALVRSVKLVRLHVVTALERLKRLLKGASVVVELLRDRRASSVWVAGRPKGLVVRNLRFLTSTTLYPDLYPRRQITLTSDNLHAVSPSLFTPLPRPLHPGRRHAP
jgi:hypothetical protein